jgi:hypothetical protein
VRTKSPSAYDGKPVGTPTDAVSPQQAGCTFGLDNIEQMASDRRERKRALRQAQKERRRVGHQEAAATGHRGWKRRRCIVGRFNKGIPIAQLATEFNLSPDDIMGELKYAARRHQRNRKKKASRQRNAVV